MYKKVCCIWFTMVLGVLITSQTAFSASPDQTEIGVQFGQYSEKVKPRLPSTYMPAGAPTKDGGGQLPKLGQMITSFTFLLTGIFCVILVGVVFSSKKIFMMNGQENR